MSQKSAKKQNWTRNQGKKCSEPSCESLARIKGLCLSCYKHKKGNFKRHYKPREVKRNGLQSA